MEKGNVVEILAGYEDWYQDYVTRHGGGKVDFVVHDGAVGTVQTRTVYAEEAGGEVFLCRFHPPGLSVYIPSRFLKVVPVVLD